MANLLRERGRFSLNRLGLAKVQPEPKNVTLIPENGLGFGFSSVRSDCPLSVEEVEKVAKQLSGASKTMSTQPDHPPVSNN